MGNKLNRHSGPKFLLIKSLERPLVHKFTLRPNKSSRKWQKTQKRDKWSKAQAKGQLGQDEARFTFPGKSRGFPDSRLFGNDYLPRFSCSASGLRMQFKDSDSLSVDLISNNNLVMCATCVDFHWKIIIPHKYETGESNDPDEQHRCDFWLFPWALDVTSPYARSQAYMSIMWYLNFIKWSLSHRQISQINPD